MKGNKLKISGMFLRDCIRKFNYITQNHLEAHKYVQMEHLQNVADRYFEHFQRGELDIKATETQTFADYIDTFGLEQKDELLDKLQAQVFYDVREYLAQQKDNSSSLRLWNRPKSEKFSFMINMWQKVKNKVKYIIPTTMIVLGGVLGLKSDSSAAVQTEMPKENTKGLPNFQRYGMPKPIDYTLDAYIKQASIQAQKDTTVSENGASTNFYRYRLAQFLGKKKSSKMLENMAHQVESGKIILPNDISPAHYLYAAEIYRRYGYVSIAKTMNDVLKSKKEVLPEVQSSLFRYVRLAGNKGVGVQKMRFAQNTKAQLARG